MNSPQAKPRWPWLLNGVLPIRDKCLLKPSVLFVLLVYNWCSYQIKIHIPPENYVCEEPEPATASFLSFIKAIQAGKPLPIVTIGVNTLVALRPTNLSIAKPPKQFFQRELDMKISLIRSAFKTLTLCLSSGSTLTATQAQEQGKHALDYTYAEGDTDD